MAQHDQDQEDLLRDGSAFVPRVELKVPGNNRSQTIFAGFRAYGALSIYFDSEPVYHFNSNCQLRRAYWEGRQLKAEQGLLIAFKTSRTDTTVDMLRHDMTNDEQQQFCDSLAEHLQSLEKTLQNHKYEVTGMVPEGSDVLERLQAWLHQFQGVQIADYPRVA